MLVIGLYMSLLLDLATLSAKLSTYVLVVINVIPELFLMLAALILGHEKGLGTTLQAKQMGYKENNNPQGFYMILQNIVMTLNAYIYQISSNWTSLSERRTCRRQEQKSSNWIEGVVIRLPLLCSHWKGSRLHVFYFGPFAFHDFHAQKLDTPSVRCFFTLMFATCIAVSINDVKSFQDGRVLFNIKIQAPEPWKEKLLKPGYFTMSTLPFCATRNMSSDRSSDRMPIISVMQHRSSDWSSIVICFKYFLKWIDLTPLGLNDETFLCLFLQVDVFVDVWWLKMWRFPRVFWTTIGTGVSIDSFATLSIRP